MPSVRRHPIAAAAVAAIVTVSCAQSRAAEPAAPAAPEPTPSTTSPVIEDEATTTSEFLSTTSTTAPFRPTVLCYEEPPPPYGEVRYQFDPTFYVHYCSAAGIFVVGSDNTPIEALEAAARIVERAIGHDPGLVTAGLRTNHAVILTGPGETAGDLPEWEFEEGRTFSPDPDHPGFVSSGGGITYVVAPADDVVCAVPDHKHGSYGTPDWGIVLVHELGHVLERALGLSGLDALYDLGVDSGAWDLRHYAMSSPGEYWAEVVQVYLGQYEHRRRGFRQPSTRAELRAQDPAAFALAESILGGSTLTGYWCDEYDGPVTPLPPAPETAPETN